MVIFLFASLVLNRPRRFLMWRHPSNSIGWGDLAWGRGCFFAVLLSYLAIELRQLVLIIWAADHRFREKQNRKSCCCQFRSKNDSLEWHSLAWPCSQNYVRWCRPCSWHNYWRSFRNIRALRVLYYATFSRPKCGGSPGGTTIYGLYRYVPLWRIWFWSSLLWDRVYKSESLGLEEGIIFHLNWSIGWRF